MDQLPERSRFVLKDDLASTERALRSDLASLTADLASTERALRADLASTERVLRADFGERFDQIDRRFEKVEDRLHLIHQAMHGYVRTFVIAQVTSIFGAVGMFFGIQQLIS